MKYHSTRRARPRLIGLCVVVFCLFVIAPAAFLSGASKPIAAVQKGAAPGGSIDPKRVPQFALAAAFAVSAPAKNFPDARVGHDKETGEVKNVKNEKIIKPLVEGKADSIDHLIKSSGLGNAPTVMPGPSLTFEGNSGQDNANAYGFRVMPPDTVGDVGPNHYVQATNLLIRVFNKSGTPLTAPFKPSDLFAGLGAPCGSRNDGDPIVLYDQLADRWMYSDFCTALIGGRSSQRIAISTTNDPTGTWFTYLFIMPNTKFNDYPHFGVWPDAYYMTDNQFNQAGTAFLGAGVFAFERAKLLLGDPTASFIYFDLATSDPDSGGQLPADLDGLVPPPTGTPGLIMEFFADEFGGGFTDSLRIFEFRPNFTTPASSTFTRLTPDLPIAAFDARNPSGRTDIEQPPPATAANNVDVIADRLMHRIAYHNLGTTSAPVNSYALNFTVNVSGVTPTTAALYQAGIRWVELRRDPTTDAMSVFDQGTHVSGAISGATGANTWMGSIAQDNQGNLALGYSISSTSIFPSINWAGRTNNVMNSGILNEGEATMFAGTGVQQGSGNFVRWGDYSAMSVDPSDDCTFYYTQEYRLAANNGTASAQSFNWNTRVGAFKFSSCTTSPRGTFSGTITNCETGAPIQGAVVETTDPAGFFKVTDASGNYSITAAPGTYDVKVSKPGTGGFTMATGMVTVTDGGNAIFNACLQGVPIIMADGFTITAESCVPANNAIDPGETVTVNLCLKNTGGDDTNNLVGTLQATGGVTSPSGPQNYGAVVAGGATVCRPFTFTAANQTCGTTITATLDLTDGGSLGNITYTIPLGTLGAPTTTTYSSGNIAVPIPDVGVAEVPINVADLGAVNDVNVRVRLNHTFDGDLIIQLVHPDGTVVPLSNNRGGAGDNYGSGANDCSGTPTVFDDEAATAISAGAAPFAGSFRPETVLSALDGKTVTGMWKLRVSDTAALDTGTIGCFTLEINRLRFICCGVPGTPEIASAGATILTESCTPANGAIDPDETVTVSFCVINNGTGSTTNLVGTLQATGGVTNPSGPQNYGVVAAGGGAVCRDFTFTASGVCGGTITASIQLQDGATNLGTVTYTFTLGTSMLTNFGPFSNPTTITIPATGTSGPATPYPSPVVVAGVSGTISDISVVLNNVNHTFPDDIDILLVGPGGEKFILVSDTGGTNDAVAFTWTITDSAAALMSDGGLNSTGSYKPTNVGTGDTFVAPAPGAPYASPAPAGAATLVGTFGAATINGTWNLFVVDDVGGDIGSIGGGWSISFTTSTPVCSTSCLACTGITCPANITQSNDPNQCGAVVNYPPPTPNSSGCGTITCSPPSGSFFPKGTTTVNCTASAGPTCSFTVTVNDTQPPTINCPANITQSNDPNQCGAVVNYPPPTASDNCPGVGVPQCSPASGSFFPVGTTTVTCTVADSSGNTASCTFTITVNDTQPPTITCPANITAVTDQTVCPEPGATVCQVVTFPPPVATDNCPGVTVACVPPSGSCFPVGTTTVTCTATDASGNTATCSFTIATFDVALQDDSNPTTILLWNSQTGQYRFCCGGITFTGTGKVTRQGCVFTLDHTFASDRRVTGKVDKTVFRGTGNLQAPPGKQRCTLADSNTRVSTNITACQ